MSQQLRYGGSNFIAGTHLVNTSQVEKQRLLSTVETGRRTGGVLSTKPPGFDSHRYLSTTVYENVGTPLTIEQIRGGVRRY